MNTVKVGYLPGTLKEVVVNSGATVGEVLGLAEMNASGYEIRVNNTVSGADTTVNNGDIIVLVKQIKGNK